MKKAGLIAALSLALVAAPAASAAEFESSSKQKQAPELAVAFTIKLKNGKPKRVEDFVFLDLALTCTEGTFTISNVADPLPTMKVTKKTKKFSENFEFGGGAQLVGVSGVVKNKGKRVGGKLRVRGAFTDPATGAPVTNCDSGVVPYVAKKD